MQYITKTRIICWILLTGIALTLTAMHTGVKSDRLLLYFQDTNGTIGTEVRYVPRAAQKSLSSTVVTELLLGPVDRRFLKLVNPQVIPHSCFLRSGTLYINFPESILFPPETGSESDTGNNLDFKTVYTLMRKNILTNCKDVQAVCIYIDGRQVYEQLLDQK